MLIFKKTYYQFNDYFLKTKTMNTNTKIAIGLSAFALACLGLYLIGKKKSVATEKDSKSKETVPTQPASSVSSEPKSNAIGDVVGNRCYGEDGLWHPLNNTECDYLNYPPYYYYPYPYLVGGVYGGGYRRGVGGFRGGRGGGHGGRGGFGGGRGGRR